MKKAESLAKRKSRCMRQFYTLLFVVFLFSLGINNSPSFAKKENTPTASFITDRIKIDAEQPECFEQKEFKSDKAFDIYASKLSDEEIKRFSAEGTLYNEPITMYGIITKDGNILGRYRHKNGTTLDINGKINANDNNIDIDLGHGREHSKMTLRPYDTNSKNDIYRYRGEWGKKKKDVSLNIKIKS